jgi:hypothetical protein
MTAVAVRVRIAAREIAQHLKSLRVPASAIEYHIYQLKKWRSAHRWPPKKKLDPVLTAKIQAQEQAKAVQAFRDRYQEKKKRQLLNGGKQQQTKQLRVRLTD